MKQDTQSQIFSSDSSTGHYDDNGVRVSDETLITATNCLIVPYSRQQAIYKYGIDVEINKLIFIDHELPTINVGMIIKAKGKQYEIKSIPWDVRHMEILALSKESVSS